MKLPSSVVPAYPYEGGLYWLIGEGTVRHDKAAAADGYYKNIYGKNADDMSRRASALVALFDDIEIAVADHALPDWHRYQTDQGYRHLELRLSCSSNFSEAAEDARELTKFALTTKPKLVEILQSGGRTDEYSQQQFVERTILQARLAMRKDAALIGDELFDTVYQMLLPHMGAFIEGWRLEGEPPKSIPIQSELLDAVGLYIPSNSFDGFCEIRTSAEISKYAEDFRGALGIATDGRDLKNSLLALMREAREKRGVSKHIGGAMQTTGTWSSIGGAIAGAIPGVGVVTSVSGLVADLAARRAEASFQKHDWYTLGSKLQTMTLDVLLRKQSN
jgi:hypothetical protein